MQFQKTLIDLEKNSGVDFGYKNGPSTPFFAKQEFFSKKRSVTFKYLLNPNFMLKIRKNPPCSPSSLKFSCILTVFLWSETGFWKLGWTNWLISKNIYRCILLLNILFYKFRNWFGYRGRELLMQTLMLSSRLTNCCYLEEYTSYLG